MKRDKFIRETICHPLFYAEKCLRSKELTVVMQFKCSEVRVIIKKDCNKGIINKSVVVCWGRIGLLGGVCRLEVDAHGPAESRQHEGHGQTVQDHVGSSPLQEHGEVVVSLHK